MNDVTIDYQQQKEDHLAILNEMTRQYKGMQEDLIKRNNLLELHVAELKEQLGKEFWNKYLNFLIRNFLELTHLVLEETKKDKERTIASKDSIILEQARKMELMALEFTEMLKVEIS